MATVQKLVNQDNQQGNQHDDGPDQLGHQRHRQQQALLLVHQFSQSKDVLRQLTEEDVETGRCQFTCQLKSLLEVG